MEDPQVAELAEQERPQFAPFLWGIIWAAVQWWYLQQPHVGLWVCVGVAIIVSMWAYRHRMKLVSPRSFWLGTLVFLISSLSVISFISDDRTKILTIIATGMMLWLFLRQAIQATSDELQGRMMTFAMTLSYWFGMVSIFYLSVVAIRPWWQVVIGGSVLYLLVATIVWLDLRVPAARFRHAFFPMLWLGAELALIGWWLSSSVLVAAFVVTVPGMLMIHLCRHVWLESWKPGRSRRYLVFGLSLLVLVILTARWI